MLHVPVANFGNVTSATIGDIFEIFLKDDKDRTEQISSHILEKSEKENTFLDYL